MKKQVVFIHGGSAYSKYEDYLEHLRTTEIKLHQERSKLWSDSLAEVLGDQYEVIAPSMPCKGNAKYEEWKIWFERHFEFLHDEVILIGWSQGGYFLAKYLTENDLPFKVQQLCLLAAPFGPVDFAGEDGGDFSFDTQKLPEIFNRVSKIALFHSQDDFVVPYQHALEYQEALPGAELVAFADRNHFLQEEFPELIAYIKDL